MPIFLIFSLLLVSSCSSGTTLPPDQETIQTYRESLKSNPKAAQIIDLNRMKENQRQAFVYLQAADFLKKKNKKAACDRYKYLGKDKSFPLAQFSLIKSLKVCSYSKLGSFLIWKRGLSEIRPENKELFLTNSIALAKRLNLDNDLVKFSIELTDFLKTKKEKESHLRRLLKQYKKKPELYTQLKEKFLEIAPRFNKKPEKEDFLAIAKDYGRVRNFKKARYYYKLGFRDKSRPPLERIEAYYDYAFTYKLQREKTTFSWQLEKLLKWSNNSLRISAENHKEIKRLWELRIELARAQWTVNFRSRAEDTLNNVLTNGPQDFFAHAYFILGKIESEKKNYDASERFFKLGLAQEYIEDNILQELSWSLGFNYYLDKKYAQSKDVFYLAQTKTEDETFKRKLIFWQAKILKHLSQKGEANELLKNVAESDPYGYYGIISAMELESSLKPIALPEIEVATTYPSLEWVLALGDLEYAEALLKELEKEVDSPDEISAFLPQYARAKWYQGGISKFFKLPHDLRSEALENYLHIAYPAPYTDITDRIERRQKVPSALIYAIARQESAFNPRARSWADAFGLLQLTPEKAKSLARQLDVPYNDYSDLYREDTNLWLGAALLKRLAKEMKGSFISTVASYNAGKKPVRSWVKRRKTSDPFEFIELIPYKETQKYVKLVLRNYSIYKRLEGQEWKESADFLIKPVL